ncbi:MAG: FAD-dependent thymidylate synthase [bacterium]|nr:FAD-dependent thymidylate synthase [bacterium]
MEKFNTKIGLLPNQFRKENGTFDKEGALILSGKIGGVCYDKEGFDHINEEPLNKTQRRIERTLNNGHHSVYGHISVSLNISNIPKILAMVLNNEKEYNTSEKSARYTPVTTSVNSIISTKEIELYNKWLEIFKIKIQLHYPNSFSETKIRSLAQENARYLITVFMPTQMVYTTSLRQLNYIASWMMEYINKADKTNAFERKLAQAMQEFITELDSLNLLEERLLTNDKNRKLSLFGNNLSDTKDIFSYPYYTTYNGSFAQLAQAQRHRTIDYQMEMIPQNGFFIPPILLDDKVLVDEWLNDMNSVANITPNGQLVTIAETGTYDNFILKCKERLCTAAQLEIANQTRNTLLRYKKALEDSCSPLAQDIEKYSHGARCTFPDYTCHEQCHFPEGIKLERII